MIRLTLILSSAIFLTFLIAGRDEGQVRQGLVPREAAPAPVLLAAAPPPEPRGPLLVNEEPRRIEVRPERMEMRVAAPAAMTPAAAAPAVEGLMPVAYVTAEAVNVRHGPSTQDAVIGRLERGDALLVVWEDDTGWSRIRIEGDGVEGYVASRFLTGTPPDLSY